MSRMSPPHVQPARVGNQTSKRPQRHYHGCSPFCPNSSISPRSPDLAEALARTNPCHSTPLASIASSRVSNPSAVVRHAGHEHTHTCHPKLVWRLPGCALHVHVTRTRLLNRNNWPHRALPRVVALHRHCSNLHIPRSPVNHEPIVPPALAAHMPTSCPAAQSRSTAHGSVTIPVSSCFALITTALEEWKRFPPPSPHHACATARDQNSPCLRA